MFDHPFRDEISGYREFTEWCCGWPSFHDAEVVTLEMNCLGVSRLVVHVLGGAKPTFGPRADVRFSTPPSDVAVIFLLNDIEDIELTGFNQQNVIFDLRLEKASDLFRIELDPCYGLAGSIFAKQVSMSFLPLATFRNGR